MLTHACGKMPGCFADITGITACTCKLVYNTRTKPARDRVFHAKQIAYLKGSKNIKLVFASFKIGNLFGTHLENSEQCHALCSVECFHILDHASTTFQLKIKEAFHIRREQPSLNQQLHHVNLKLSL